MLRELMILFFTCSTLGGKLPLTHLVGKSSLRSTSQTDLSWWIGALFSRTVIGASAGQAPSPPVWVAVPCASVHVREHVIRYRDHAGSKTGASARARADMILFRHPWPEIDAGLLVRAHALSHTAGGNA